MSALHTRATLQIYSELFKYPKDENSDYWYDLFELSIIEPPLIATFKSTTNRDHVISSVFFKKCVDSFFENCKDGFDNKFLLNNLVLIMNAFFRALKEKEDIINIMFNHDVMTEENREVLRHLMKMIHTGLNEDSLVKSTVNLLMNFILAVYRLDEILEILIKADLTTIFSDKVIRNKSLSKFDYNRYFIIVSILVNNSKFKEGESNLYKRHLQASKNDQIDFKTINRYLKPILSFNLIILDDLKQDLLILKSSKSTFFNLITFNSFNRFNYNYEYLKGELDDELRILLKMKLQSMKENKNASKQLNLVESISLNLILFSLIMNNSEYCEILTQENEDESKHDNFFELFLSYASFILQNQNNDKVNHFNSRLILLIFNKLLKTNDSVLLSNILSGSIDQFKYKLCHQTEPILNNLINYQDLQSYNTNYENFDQMEENEFKFKIFYILDTLQCFVRYNLTSDIDSISYKLSLGNIFLILQKLVNNYDQAMINGEANSDILIDDFLFEYNWNDLFFTLLNLLKFLNNDKVVLRKLKKKNVYKYYSLIEETFMILSYLLINNEKLFKYGNYLIEFLYKLLEFHKVVINISIKASCYCQFVLSIIYYLLIRFDIKESMMLISEKVTFEKMNVYASLNFDNLEIIRIDEKTAQNYLFAIEKLIDQMPLTSKSNKLLNNDFRMNDLNTIIIKSTYETENFKYLKKDVCSNYKINLINESTAFLIDNFNYMFK